MICQFCNTEYTPNKYGRRSMYCSASCRVTANNSNRTDAKRSYAKEYKRKLRAEAGIRPRVIADAHVKAMMAHEKEARRKPKVLRTIEEQRKIDLDRYHERKHIPSRLIYSRVKRWMHKHLGHGIKSKKWSEVLGYDGAKLTAHIERQFTNGMGWHNRSEWHIDHIIPVSHFKFESEYDEGFKHAYALSNLRPIWARDNLVKNGKLLFLI